MSVLDMDAIDVEPTLWRSSRSTAEPAAREGRRRTDGMRILFDTEYVNDGSDAVLSWTVPRTLNLSVDLASF